MLKVDIEIILFPSSICLVSFLLAHRNQSYTSGLCLQGLPEKARGKFPLIFHGVVGQVTEFFLILVKTSVPDPERIRWSNWLLRPDP
jgi:hypothetical protein